MVVALPKVIGPEKLTEPPLFRKAPPYANPKPLRVNASSVPRVKPAKSRVAPDETVVPLALVPRADVLPSFRVPALTVVNPE